jgi:coproporphyrinogen III oxidase
MNKVLAKSEKATQALSLVESLQSRFVQSLEQLGDQPFTAAEWLRDEGRHGGGQRFGIADTPLLARASVNVSQVQYEDEPARKLASATAISTIVHPAHPRAPSVHIHISWTEQKNDSGYWRMMADLNPSIPNAEDKEKFIDALKLAAPEQFVEAEAQGGRYFYIPVLERHRGVAHFYLENYNTGDFDADFSLAKRVGEAAVDIYARILKKAVQQAAEPSEEQKAAQLAYHTLYLFQVLTLDRGTTMGLLVHDQNDVGIMGSLPAKVDKNLLASWCSRMPNPQGQLLEGIIAALPKAGICIIDDAVKKKLAAAVRTHYQNHPEALSLQASGNTTPPTIDNHR